LKDPVLQQRFETLGYCQIPLLGNDEIKELREYYLSRTGGKVVNSPYGMWISIHDAETAALKRESMNLIHNVTMPRLKEFFVDCKPHLGSYLVKVPNPRSFTFPHQDWTFVDNEKLNDLFSLTVWITLADVDIDGGALGFIKGSPQFFPDAVLGSPSPAITTLTRGHEPMLFEYLSYQPIKAGDALAFNNKTIHAAMPNTTGQQRISLGIGLTPAEATLYHYFLKPGTTDRLLKLRVEEDFFLNYSNQALFQLHQEGKVPGYCKVEGELDYSFKPLTAAEMAQLCEKHGSVRNGRPVNLKAA
jgi:hypothetical protein